MRTNAMKWSSALQVTEEISMESPARRGAADRFPDGSFGTWFVLRTRCRHEKILAGDLRARGVGYFLPLVTVRKDYGEINMGVERPLFPGFLFLRGNEDEACAADWPHRIVEIMPVDSQDELNCELRHIHMALSGGGALEPHPRFEQGMQVEVREGPFRGLRGVIEDWGRPNRLILQIQVLRRAVSLEIEGSLLDVVHQHSA